MKKIVFVFAFFLTLAQTAAAQTFTLPYEVAGGKMLVNVEVGGVSRRFIFDTGGQTMITAALKDELNPAVLDSVKVTDVNSAAAYYYRVALDKFRLPGSTLNFRTSAMVYDGDAFDCFGAQGLVGNDFLKNFTMEIDSRTKTVTLNMSKPLPPTASNVIAFMPNRQQMPILTLSLANGEQLNVLFDTGFASMLALKESDYDALKESGSSSVQVLAEGKGGGEIGIAGGAATRNMTRLKVGTLFLGTAGFSNIVTETSVVPFTLLGLKALDYGKVTIDYKRMKMDFEPFAASFNDVLEAKWNVEMSVRDGGLVVSGLWGDMVGELSLGDRVLKIDNKTIEGLDMCTVLINGLPELKDKTKVTLTVEHNGQTKKVVILKQ